MSSSKEVRDINIALGVGLVAESLAEKFDSDIQAIHFILGAYQEARLFRMPLLLPKEVVLRRLAETARTKYQEAIARGSQAVYFQVLPWEYVADLFDLFVAHDEAAVGVRLWTTQPAAV